MLFVIYLKLYFEKEKNMPTDLFTIGGSVSQGFMGMAAARTDLCYSSLIARLLNI